MTTSAGILPFVRKGNEVFIFLCHPGGPYYRNKNYHWTFSKGVVEQDEQWKDTALREFSEETGLVFTKEVFNKCRDIVALFTKSGKKVVCYIVELDDFLDLSTCKSNFFTIPNGKFSGKYPEIDDYKWFTLEEAKSHIEKYQLPLIKNIEELIFDTYCSS